MTNEEKKQTLQELIDKKTSELEGLKELIEALDQLPLQKKKVLVIEVPGDDAAEIPWVPGIKKLFSLGAGLDESDFEALEKGEMLFVNDIALSLEEEEPE